MNAVPERYQKSSRMETSHVTPLIDGPAKATIALMSDFVRLDRLSSTASPLVSATMGAKRLSDSGSPQSWFV
jgi:hypothetical protein